MVMGKGGTRELLLFDGKLMAYEKDKNKFAILRTDVDKLDLVDDDLEEDIRQKIHAIFNEFVDGTDNKSPFVVLYSNETREDGSRKCYFASIDRGLVEAWVNTDDGTIKDSQSLVKVAVKDAIESVRDVLDKGAEMFNSSTKAILTYMNKFKK